MDALRIEEKCRLCDAPALETILDLGKQPLANSLLRREDLNHNIDKYPLTLMRCSVCGCLQLRETVSPELLFSTYLYLSSYADALVHGAREVCGRMTSLYQLGEKDLVVEIGSNDGYLLQFYQEKGIPVLGVEPAENIARIAWNDRAIPTLVNFFSRDLAKNIKEEYSAASVIHANNVLAHIAGLHDVIEGMCELLSPSGIIAAEVSYIREMVAKCYFDMIYHEHLFYHSLDSLRRLFAMHGLEIFDVECIPTHGGSLRVFASHPGRYAISQRYLKLSADERATGILDLPLYQNFALRVEAIKRTLIDTLAELKRMGRSIAAYGAPAKATVLLNYFGIGPEVLDFIVDRSPHKQGKFLPGPNLPILHPDQVRKTSPDYLLILPWNLKEEIIKQMECIKEWGGKFIIPLPEVRII